MKTWDINKHSVILRDEFELLRDSEECKMKYSYCEKLMWLAMNGVIFELLKEKMPDVDCKLWKRKAKSVINKSFLSWMRLAT